MLLTPLVLLGTVVAPCLCWVREMENKDLFQGDIILDPDEVQKMENGGNAYGSQIGKRWPKIGNHAVVPYVFAEEIRTSRSALRGIEVAMAAYHKYTCIRFKPRSNEKNFITIVGGSGCASSIGMKDNPKYPQKVHLGRGCLNPHTVIHELGHAMGLWHEQSRPDRDSYLNIHWDNIAEIMKFNFRKASRSDVDSLGTPYDYRSVMHYDEVAFGDGSLTIETKDPYYQKIIGTSNGFSRMDIKQLNLMYNCPAYTGPFPERQPTDRCYDSDSRCWNRIADERDACKRNRRVRAWCRFSCNLCGTEKGTDPLPTHPAVTIPDRWTAPTTKDPNPNCPKDVWSNCKDVKSYCNRTDHWGTLMKRNCKKTCNFCD